MTSYGERRYLCRGFYTQAPIRRFWYPAGGLAAGSPEQPCHRAPAARSLGPWPWGQSPSAPSPEQPPEAGQRGQGLHERGAAAGERWGVPAQPRVQAACPLCTLPQSQTPRDGGALVGSTAGLPNASAKNPSGKSCRHAWLAPLSRGLRPEEPVTDPLPATITSHSPGTGNIHPPQK